jgi:hypothetical protein
MHISAGHTQSRRDWQRAGRRGTRSSGTRVFQTSKEIESAREGHARNGIAKLSAAAAKNLAVKPISGAQQVRAAGWRMRVNPTKAAPPS